MSTEIEMQNKVLSTLVDAMRGTGEHHRVLQERALQIVAWAALSMRGDIEEGLSLATAIRADDKQVASIIVDRKSVV